MDADVIIGGGGFVGLSLALALARKGLSVTVADPVTPSAAADAAFDGRVSALSYASLRMFERLGVGADLASEAQPIEQILVTDATLDRPPSPFSLHFDGEEIGGPLGAIAENRAIRRALYAAVARQPIRLIAPAAVTGCSVEGAGVRARLSDGTELSAALLVAADGRESRLREEMGIGTVGWSYGQNGIVATVTHEKPHLGTAYEHFLPSGPFAILPLTGNRSSLVWTEKTADAASLMRLEPAEFLAEIARRFGDHLGAVAHEGPRWSYPLRFHLAREYVRPRFALAGDAAHGIHPIAGQGLNLGLRDVAALADVIADAAELGRDIGTLDVLKTYERWRRFDSFAMGLTMDAFNRLFSNDIAPLRLARDLGMGMVDRIAPLRRYFMREAGGDVGKLPSLMQA
ncbi:FAD-dependent monooxygenase [Rhizomicrobium electricum]|uniref:UbiH/UbiF/VisC/COQ6 family ubiquinone biosynthesis hydroxylase n=1 Tax=Rhizomicrobium electricum TaxID=480070 RepID=A0ABP3Q9A5_9PROT|nr:FAD-dependent monooxygenase [Rhizomicrobium electricum]NIJ49413.1 2-octaprenyl-6-methoxyphenol hydroxylase [Rhizomicrobium electricum]